MRTIEVTEEQQVIMFKGGLVRAPWYILEKLTGIDHTVLSRHVGRVSKELGVFYCDGEKAREELIARAERKIARQRAKRMKPSFKAKHRTCDGLDLCGWARHDELYR